MKILISPCSDQELCRARAVWPDDIVTNVWSDTDDLAMYNWFDTESDGSDRPMPDAPDIYIRRYRVQETEQNGFDLLLAPEIGVKMILVLIDPEVLYSQVTELRITAPHIYGHIQSYPFHDVSTTEFIQADGQLDWDRIRALIEERPRVLEKNPEQKWSA